METLKLIRDLLLVASLLAGPQVLSILLYLILRRLNDLLAHLLSILVSAAMFFYLARLFVSAWAISIQEAGIKPCGGWGGVAFFLVFVGPVAQAVISLMVQIIWYSKHTARTAGIA
jgi:hypothetical protein